MRTNIFRLQNNTPQVYQSESRDFQLLSRAFDAIHCGVMGDILSISNLDRPRVAYDSMLTAYASRVGFFSPRTIDAKVLRYILAAFPYVIKNKGTKEGIRQAVTTVIKAENHTYLNGSIEIELINNPWVLKQGVNLTCSDSEPLEPELGDYWYQTDNEQLMIYKQVDTGNSWELSDQPFYYGSDTPEEADHNDWWYDTSSSTLKIFVSYKIYGEADHFIIIRTPYEIYNKNALDEFLKYILPTGYDYVLSLYISKATYSTETTYHTDSLTAVVANPVVSGVRPVSQITNGLDETQPPYSSVAFENEYNRGSSEAVERLKNVATGSYSTSNVVHTSSNEVENTQSDQSVT